MKIRRSRVVAWSACLAIAGMLAVVAGIVPIGASSGHWPASEWLIRFSMRRSIATHSSAVEAPPLDDPALVLRGATHYHAACAPCHGSPARPHAAIAQQMLPRPRRLADGVGEWTDEQLFYVTKHGIKFTGMPAWPTQRRDDEVWAVVAFLRELPEVDDASYRRLAIGDGPAAVDATLGSPSTQALLRESCARCHGHDGLGRDGAFPRLAGQSREYLRNALLAYASGARASGFMQPLSAGLSPGSIDALASHYASLAPSGEPSDAGSAQRDAASIARGEAIARDGIPQQNVPSCSECHGPGAARASDAFPSHAGQPAEYLERQLELFRDDARGGSPYARLMQPIASRLSAQQARDVAAYYASLAPTSRDGR